jgi:hypothetical protein
VNSETLAATTLAGRWRAPVACVCVCVTLLLAGCVSLFGDRLGAITFHTLTPTAEAPPPSGQNGGGLVGVQTVRLPEYLNQRGIVTRTTDTELRVADDVQWAGSLDDNMTQVIAADLSALLASSRVVTFPVNPSLPLDRVVQIDVARFDSGANNEVILDAQWLVFADGGRTFLTTNGRRYRVQAADGSYAAIVSAMSAATGQLSRDIAASLSAERGRRLSLR